MKPENNVTNLPAAQQSPPPRLVPVANIFNDPVMFDHYQRIAVMFSKSTLVPPHMQNVANCLIALDIGNRLNEQPLTVMQNIYVVSGRPGWKTEYVIARANRSGVFKGRITWKTTGSGADLAVTATATLADTGEAVDATCDMAMARAEEWTRNKKYTSMPEHMLRWRSAAFLIRLYAPEVMLGIPVIEEIETLPEVMRDVTPPTQAMRDALDDFAGSPATAGDELSNDATADEADKDFEEATQAAAAAAAAATAKAAEADKVRAEAAKAEAAKQAKAEAEATKQLKKAAADKAAADKAAEANAAKEPEKPAGPKNAAGYFEALKVEVDKATDPAALKAWFLSKEQKDLRGACAVIGDDAERCKNYTLAKIGDLQSKGA